MTNSDLTFHFPPVRSKDVTARFDGGDITSDTGALLLARADKKIRLVGAISREIIDDRQASKVRHSLETLLRQRIIAIACGYEDANDFGTLASDPAFKLACKRAPKSDPDLASQPTLSRLENRVNTKDLFCMACAIGRSVVAQLPEKTKQVILDIDAYEDPCHGQQEFEFFNAHYDSHCYLPLAIFITAGDGVQRLMGAMLRPGNAGNAGVRALIRLAVDIIREQFPHVKIILRADAGFGNDRVLRLCDKLNISYCLGLATNSRLQELSTKIQMRTCWQYTFAKDLWRTQGACRLYGHFEYKASTWKRTEHVIVKSEVTRDTLNPRFVVTNLYHLSPAKAYAFYCKRGDIENRIKEFKLDLAAGRTSCHRFLANQFRVLLHLAAAVLVDAIQIAAKKTEYAHAQASTIRLRLLKLGARVVETARRIWIHMSSSYPSQVAWSRIYAALGP